MYLARVIGVHARIGILKDLQYRVNFAGQLVNSALGFLLAIGSILVVFRHTDLLGDWTQTDLIMLIGVFSIVRGFINLFVRPGLQAYMEGIRTGLFDYVLLKPLDSQLYVSIREFRIWSLVDLLTGVGLVVWSGWVGGLDASLFTIVLFFVTMLAGFSVVLAFWFILGTSAFWFIKVDNIFVVFDSLFQTARWPLTVYPGAVRILLTFVVPVAWAVTMPAATLAGKLEIGSLWLTLLVPAFFVAVSRIFWKIGIRHYSGASA